MQGTITIEIERIRSLGLLPAQIFIRGWDYDYLVRTGVLTGTRNETFMGVPVVAVNTAIEGGFQVAVHNHTIRTRL